MSFKEAGKLACKAASKLVTQFGARLSNEQPQSLLGGLPSRSQSIMSERGVLPAES